MFCPINRSCERAGRDFVACKLYLLGHAARGCNGTPQPPAQRPGDWALVIRYRSLLGHASGPGRRPKLEEIKHSHKRGEHGKADTHRPQNL